jgi:hypothetical protein
LIAGHRIEAVPINPLRFKFGGGILLMRVPIRKAVANEENHQLFHFELGVERQEPEEFK